MDLHAWITQQVDRDERLIDEKGTPTQVKRLLLRIEADRRILVRHRIDPSRVEDWMYATACEGCGDWGEFGYPNSENLNDCPELLDLAHAHGLTDEILAGLDRPTPPERSLPADAAYELRITRYPTRPITTSDVPEALRGPHWKP